MNKESEWPVCTQTPPAVGSSHFVRLSICQFLAAWSYICLGSVSWTEATEYRKTLLTKKDSQLVLWAR